MNTCGSLRAPARCRVDLRSRCRRPLILARSILTLRVRSATRHQSRGNHHQNWPQNETHREQPRKPLSRVLSNCQSTPFGCRHMSREKVFCQSNENATRSNRGDSSSTFKPTSRSMCAHHYSRVPPLQKTDVAFAVNILIAPNNFFVVLHSIVITLNPRDWRDDRPDSSRRITRRATFRLWF